MTAQEPALLLGAQATTCGRPYGRWIFSQLLSYGGNISSPRRHRAHGGKGKNKKEKGEMFLTGAARLLISCFAFFLLPFYFYLFLRVIRVSVDMRGMTLPAPCPP